MRPLWLSALCLAGAFAGRSWYSAERCGTGRSARSWYAPSRRGTDLRFWSRRRQVPGSGNRRLVPGLFIVHGGNNFARRRHPRRVALLLPSCTIGVNILFRIETRPDSIPAPAYETIQTATFNLNMVRPARPAALREGAARLRVLDTGWTSHTPSMPMPAATATLCPDRPRTTNAFTGRIARAPSSSRTP